MRDSEKPYWYPVRVNEDYFKRLREDYPEKAHLNYEALNDYFNDGREFSILWDHVGDAYDDYVPLANAFLDMYDALWEAVELSDRTLPESVRTDECQRVYDLCVAALKKAEGE